MNIQSRLLAKNEYKNWDEFVLSSDSGNIYATSRYLDALCSATGERVSIVVLENGGRIVAGAPIYETPTRWGTVIRPRSLLPYNGFVIANPDSTIPSRQESTRHALFGSLAAKFESLGALSITVRCMPPFRDARVFLQRGWTTTPTYTYTVDLSELDSQWTLLDRKMRSQIKKSASAGYSVAESDDFDTFFSHHYHAHATKHFALYLPKPKFRDYFRSLRIQGLARLFMAYDSSSYPVASQLVLAGPDHRCCHIVSAGSREELLDSGVNALLRWRSFEHLASIGYREVDLTDASLNSVSRFKSKFGSSLKLSLALGWAGGNRVARSGYELESFLRRLTAR